jgi:multidrug resistance efflux pump
MSEVHGLVSNAGAIASGRLDETSVADFDLIFAINTRATWLIAVQSISPAAAQEFSLLPAQNTSGNWVKVVQRIPMRIRVDTSDRNLPRLRAGMSVEVNVDTGHARGLPHFLAALFGHSRRQS